MLCNGSRDSVLTKLGELVNVWIASILSHLCESICPYTATVSHCMPRSIPPPESNHERQPGFEHTHTHSCLYQTRHACTKSVDGMHCLNTVFTPILLDVSCTVQRLLELKPVFTLFSQSKSAAFTHIFWVLH